MPTVTRNIRKMQDGRWRVRYRLGTREIKRIFETEAGAKEFVNQERQRILAKGRTALALTQLQDARILMLLTEMSEDGDYEEGLKNLERAAKAYKKAGLLGGDPTVAEVVERLVASWKKLGRDPTYISNAGGLLKRFGESFPSRTLRSLSLTELEGWIADLNAADPKTPKARLSALYSFARRSSLVETNIVKEIVLQRQKKKQVPIPTFAEIDRVMSALCVTAEYRPLLSGYSRRLFSGARAKEARDVRVRVESKSLIVPAGAAAKNGDARQVNLDDTALAWERWCDQHVGREHTPAQIARLDRNFRTAMGMVGKKWCNWQRHSYASYKLPLLGNDLEELAQQMGNSVRVLKNNYLGNVTEADVPLFWALRPPDTCFHGSR